MEPCQGTAIQTCPRQLVLWQDQAMDEGNEVHMGQIKTLKENTLENI